MEGGANAAGLVNYNVAGEEASPASPILPRRVVLVLLRAYHLMIVRRVNIYILGNTKKKNWYFLVFSFS